MKSLQVAALCIIFCGAFSSSARTQRPVRIAVLDFRGDATASRVTDNLLNQIQSRSEFQIVDRDQARAAARGAGYSQSLNVNVRDARDLGSAIGCDFFILGEAQTLKRTPLEGAGYFESYAAIYLVSARTGRLAFWEVPAVQRATAAEAERDLLKQLAASNTIDRYAERIKRTADDERAYRASAVENPPSFIEVMSDEDDGKSDVQSPRPYQRLKPAYTDIASQFGIEASVDALVDIDADGEVRAIEISRWAGYGLDESVIDTIKRLHFFPAHRDGVAIPMRVLLRYNFRKPPPQR